MIEQLLDIMRAEGWTDESFPKVPIWIDVRNEHCMSNPTECIKHWEQIGLIGIVFAVFTGVCILATVYYDCQTDRQVRRAQMYAQIKAMLPTHRPELVRVHPQGKDQLQLQSSQTGTLRSSAATSDRTGMAIQDGPLGGSGGGHRKQGIV